MNNLDTIIIMDIMQNVLTAAEYDSMDDLDLFALEHKIAYKLITCVEMDFDITVEYENGGINATFKAYDENDMCVVLTTPLVDDEDEIYEQIDIDEEAASFVLEVSRMIDLLEKECEHSNKDSVLNQEALDTDNFDRAMEIL